ncbi:efflux RND transporter permease subunit [Dawidia soli]|uniref:Efflux RND transporter permease subunit n=1 Tax=Dawidia soli TaxID=2782352 RepID=A0AAP2D718_9BACT|nr:efflux RND transporter permease subunit [Dawidia soli]MBT1686439.1 efflux RND transporter permease subunit [Dawidia soli]
MSLTSSALRRPITTIVLTASLMLFSVLAAIKIPIDIFPQLNMPTIYVIESYGGMSAQQMEGFFSTRLQDQFLYVNGIRNITAKNIQGLTLLKLSFYEDTDMAEASAQVALQVNRAMKFFPPGALPPQVIRFDASSLPIGQLVISSKSRSLKEIYDIAATRVRPAFASIPGLSAPPPFGANSRAITVNVDPARLRSYNLTPDDVVNALASFNVMSPSGNLRLDNTMFLTTINTLIKTVEEFGEVPITTKNGVSVLVKDVARVADAADVTVDYALINGKRAVYIPVVKTADASTWQVVQTLKKKLPDMQSLLPDDVVLSYEFDQSVFVINAVKSLITEGALGAILTGLMVLLFLRDVRSSLIVVVTIPISILSGVFLLSLFGHTINIMTLSGLALAIGILVDQATVTIENIHQHLEMGKDKKQAIFDACQEVAFPLLLILLCILAVFAPSFLMQGVPKAMFLPLSLSIGLTMIVSYVAALTVVPILSNWFIKHKHNHPETAVVERVSFFDRIKTWFTRTLEINMPRTRLLVILYFVGVIAIAAAGFLIIGKDMMPKTNVGQFQIRFKEPDGTRLERTEEKVRRVLHIIDTTVAHNVAISSAYIGLIPSSYGTSNLYVFNTGTHEAVIQVNLHEDYKVNMDDLKEALRKNIRYHMPEARLSFEPIDLTEKIMSQGASTPIEVRVAGKDMKEIEGYASKLVTAMKKIPELRDVQIAQPLHFPVISISIDRLRAAQLGLDVTDIARSVTASTSSSRFTQKNQWLDEAKAYTYQVQVQIPEHVMNTMDELREIPLIRGQSSPVLGDIASFKTDYVPGEYDRSGPRRFLTVGANIHHKDLGYATDAVEAVIRKMGTPPKGMVVEVKGMSSLLRETLDSLQNGLILAVVVILLLLAANYQSVKLALTVISTVPAVVAGALLLLLATGSTLNLQSYMGMIMSIGVSVANAILIVTNAETIRLQDGRSEFAAVSAASLRLRPILMTSLAMIAGMVPMAAGMGEAGEQSAPLGRAVIGGLLASTLSALFILPHVFAWVQRRASRAPVSLMPSPKVESLEKEPQLQH